MENQKYDSRYPILFLCLLGSYRGSYLTIPHSLSIQWADLPVLVVLDYTLACYTGNDVTTSLEDYLTK